MMLVKSLLPHPTHTSKERQQEKQKTSSYHNLPTSRRPLRPRSKTGANASFALHPEYKSVLCALPYMQVPNHFNYPPLARHLLSHWLTTIMHASVLIQAPGTTPPPPPPPPPPTHPTHARAPCSAPDVGTASSIPKVCWHHRGAMLLAHPLSQTRARSAHYSLQTLYCAVSNQFRGRRISNMAFFWNVGIPLLILWWLAHHLMYVYGASLTLSRLGSSQSQFYINSTMTLSNHIQAPHDVVPYRAQ